MKSGGIESNKALYFRFATLLGENNLAALDDLLAAGFVDHSLPDGTQPGAAALKDVGTSLLGHLPDLHLTLEDVIAEADKVVGRVRVHGTSRTGQVIAIEVIDIVRIAGGRIAERWSQHSDCEPLDRPPAPPWAATAAIPETESQSKERKPCGRPCS